MRILALSIATLRCATGLVTPRPHAARRGPVLRASILRSSRDDGAITGKRRMIRAKGQELGKTLLQQANAKLTEQRPSLMRGARRALSDFRSVTNEIVDYTVASAQLSRQNLMAWAQAFAALAACVAAGAATASGSAAAFPELVGKYGAARALAARATAAVFALGFGIALRQNKALIGNNGLAPYPKVLERVENRTAWARIEALPTLLWLSKNRTDSALTAVAGLGLAIAAPCALGGALHGGGRFALVACYACYASISNVGGPFYGYGWESQLLETAALCALPSHPEWVGVLALRWLACKVMLGAGLIKLRARGRVSDGWHDLTAMTTFFETQPLPSPMSRRLHFAPRGFHLFATASNHAIELFAPLGLIVGCLLRMLPFGGLQSVGRSLVVFYGLVHVLFQAALIGSGNLSFLNWLTIIPALACFDDAALMWLVNVAPPLNAGPGLRWVVNLPLALGLATALAWLNAPVYENLVGPARKDNNTTRPQRQIMNGSFDRLLNVRRVCEILRVAPPARPVNLRSLRLANTFGAFGSVERSRDLLVVEGSRGPGEDWREFDFRGQRADLSARPPLLAPWHWRLDWQMWIAACQGPNATSERWFTTLLLRLLENDAAVSSLLHANPFLESEPPTHVRVSQYRYAFCEPDDGTDAVWTRELQRVLVRPIGKDALREALRT